MSRKYQSWRKRQAEAAGREASWIALDPAQRQVIQASYLAAASRLIEEATRPSLFMRFVRETPR